MKKRLAVILFLSGLMLSGMAWAESPVVVSHKLTGYTKVADSVVLDYTLTVRNAGDSIADLTLSFIPLMIASKNQITLNIGNLAPQMEVSIPFTLTTPMLLEQAKFSGQTLFWSGTCVDNIGKRREFPARSVDGGAL